MIALIHIKKTAGKTLKHIMRCEYGSAHCDVKRWHSDDVCFSGADLTRLRRLVPHLRSIAGHSVRSTSDMRDVEPALRYYTFLRDPIARCVSQYQYSVQQGRCAPGSFAAWIAEPQHRNVQTQSLAGCQDAEAAITQIGDHIDFVGLMERFDESLALMQPILVLPRFAPLLRRVNAASDHAIRDALLADDKAMATVRAANTLDLQVFEYVQREVFLRQQQEASRTQVAVDGLASPRISARQFNTRFASNGLYRYLIYKPAVAGYRVLAAGRRAV